MSQTALQPGFTPAAFEAFLASRSEPSWVGALRRQGFQAFQSLALPQRNEEEWRRTDLRGLKLDHFGFAQDATGLETPHQPLLSQGVELGGQISSLNSQPRDSWLAPELAAQGILFGNLEDLLREHDAQLRPFLGCTAPAQADKFSALHAAAWSGGPALFVPRGVKVALPLHAWSAMTAGSVDFSHSLIVLEEGAEATLMVETVGEGHDPGLHCGSIEIVLAAGAKLRYVNLQNWGTGVWHFARQKALVGRQAQLQWTIGALGARLAKVNQHVELIGENSQAQVNGVMFTEGRQHLAYHTLQHHRVPRATSDLLYKGALQDQSQLVWRGMIKVDVGADKTDGYQRNDNLMLSETARADSIPGLEIEADDVICTHGATTGYVEEEQVFYAQTRGLTRKEATRMIVAGFFQQVFDRITIESVREALAEAIGRRIREYQ